MRGNDQEEELQMKFTPESSAVTKGYQAQQYTKSEFDPSQPEQTENYSLTGVKDNEREAVS